MVEKLEIIKYGHPNLRKVSTKIKELSSPQYEDLSQKMLSLMYQVGGIGLAAPQVSINERFFVIHLKEPAELPNDYPDNPLYEMMPITLINPEIEFLGTEKVKMQEGCLSIPKLQAFVMRPKKILLSAQLLNGKSIVNLECDALLSRCIQHESDHLDGVLFVDKIAKNDYKKMEKKLVKISNEYNG